MTKEKTVAAAVPRAKQTGIALEMDAIKKIGHQLDRLVDAGSRHRALSFVQSWAEGKAQPTAAPSSKQEPLFSLDDE